jgi:hypothetical protein
MKRTLLEKCNADVFKAILQVKEQSPVIREHLIAVLQKHEYWWQMTGLEMLEFSANLPHELWNGKIYTFHLLFESQQTTQMP